VKRFVAYALAVTSAFSVTPSALADDAEATPEASIERVQTCATDHDRARQMLLAERWIDARAAMRACAADPCPLAISSDCQAWLDDLNRMLPTALILIERSPGAPTPKIVELDGAPLTLSDPPTPLELLPGVHHLRITLDTGAPLARDFALKKAEKNHIERVNVPAPEPAVKRSAHPKELHRPVPTVTYLLAGGAVAAFAGSTAWLVSGLHERSDARATCAPVCDPEVRTSIDTRLLFSDLSAGAGVALGALALYSFLQRPTVARDIEPALDAGASRVSFSLRGRF